MSHISRLSTILLFTSFFKNFSNCRKQIKRVIVFSSRPLLFPAFFNTGTIDETFQQSIKQDFIIHMLKSSASMYEISGSQFFRTTTGIQSGPHAFDESRLVMTFLASRVVTEILCSFRLVLEEKTGKEISESSRLELLEKFLANNFVLPDAEDNTSGLLNRGDIADLHLLRTVFAICQKC